MITIDKNELLVVVNTVMKAVKAKTTMPILECICVQSTGTSLVLEATNMELAIRTEIPCIAERESFCINAKSFSDILKKMPNTDVSISVDDKYNITLAAGKKIKLTVAGLSVENFPFMKMDNETGFTIPSADFIEAVNGVAFCSSNNDSNKSMTAVHFKTVDNKLRMCALDGHRIGIRTIPLSAQVAPFDIMILAEYLQDIIKVLPAENVEIAINDKSIVFQYDSTVITSRLIDGNFFDIDRMLSISSDTEITVNCQELYATADRALLITNSEEKKPIVFDILADTMNVSASSERGNTLNEEIEITKKGKDLRIGFNPKFVTDMLRVIPDEAITMQFSNPKAPVIVTGETYTYLILPVNMR